MEHKEEKPLGKIGRYELRRKIAEGGMGEIFLAYDTICHREVALKKIKEEKMSRRYMKRRFLREALLTCRLSHPSIIPIYSIHTEDNVLYYTMPFIEGSSLVEILHQKRKEELNPRHRASEGSIPHLVRHFLSVCQAVDYAHAKWILHRDLKPENIMIGRFGEVYLLDWGVAGYVDEVEKENDPVGELISNLTFPGSVPGTLAFMAPECANDQLPTIQSEVFSLGVILYMILTLDFPFRRVSMEEFKKSYRFERLTPPEELAPYRDIPRQLSEIVKKCLAYQPIDRYSSVGELIADLENYLEGRPEWILTKSLDIHRSSDWEFQENVLLAQHIAITRSLEVSEWAFLMISKDAFAGNTQIIAEVSLQEQSHGIGFLISIPEPSERRGLEDGYCLWIGSESNPGCTLFRNNVEVLVIPEIFLKKAEQYEIAIERVDNNLKVFIDAKLELNYHSYIPISGSHVGMIYKDDLFQLISLDVYTGSQNVMVKCLSIPDAFLAAKEFNKAFAEYQRIASSFRGRTEEREALFFSGITKIEQAKRASSVSERDLFLLQAVEQFERLRITPGAPMEYLGKALVYVLEGDIEEEVKCLELAVRKYPSHHLLLAIEEHTICRMHETSRIDRVGAYRFALLSVRFLSHTFSSPDSHRLLISLIRHLEPLPFIQSPPLRPPSFTHLAIQLAFWLCKPAALVEIIETVPQNIPHHNTLICNALFALLELGITQKVHEKLIELKSQLHLIDNEELRYAFNLIQIAFQTSNITIERSFHNLFALQLPHIGFREVRTVRFIFEEHLNRETASTLLGYFTPLYAYSLTESAEAELRILQIQTLLYAGELAGVKALFEKEDSALLSSPTSPLYSLYGCYLAASAGEKAAQAHLSALIDETSPPTSSLLGLYLQGAISLEKERTSSSFFWERVQLYRQLILYYTCLGKERKASSLREELEKEYTLIKESL